MSRRKRKVFPVFLWHRRLGLVTMVFIVILSITGIMLNHTESLSLDQRTLDDSWLLDWYGLNPQSNPLSFSAGGHVITAWDDQLFFNSRPLMNASQTLRGAVKLDNMIALGMESTVILLDDTSGDLIERIDTSNLFGRIHHIGVDKSRLVIATTEGAYFRADPQVIDWEPTELAQLSESQPVPLDNRLREQLLRAYRGQGLTLERVILDLHSGRIFNQRWGTYIMDASAIVLLWLVFSGLWVWGSRRRKMKTKKHYRKHH